MSRVFALSLSAIVASTVPIQGAARVQAAVGGPVEVHTRLSRTAVYLGEPVIYTIELRCAPGVDVLLEDLQRERLPIEGGEITQVETLHEDGGGDPIVRRVRFTVVSFSVEASELRIGALRVRYFPRGASGTPTQTAPAGEVSIPAAIVAIRSTIAEWDEVPQPRVPQTGRGLPSRVTLAPVVGWTLLALAALPLILWAATSKIQTSAVLARLKTLRRPRRHLSLSELRLLDPHSDPERIDAFTRLDSAIRDHLRLTTGIPAHALTPPEIRDALEHSGSPLRVDAVAALLDECERARYDPTPLGQDDWANALREAEQVLGR